MNIDFMRPIAAVRTLIGIIAFATIVAGAYASPSSLLPTSPLAAQVRRVAKPIGSQNEVETHRRMARTVRGQITAFVIHQLEVMPAISALELQQQLRRVLCVNNSEQCGTGNNPPNVFAEPWGPKTDRRQIVIAYLLDLGFISGSDSVIESYEWNDGKARLAAEGGEDMNGRQLTFKRLAWYPDDEEYWILASGPTYGWSGRAFPGRAVLYRVGVNTGIRALWSRSLPNLKVQLNELGWEASYVDRERFYHDLPKPSVFDVYRFDYAKRQFSRVIHYTY
jgi:hypothetical protein